jgi:hypothetical protein
MWIIIGLVVLGAAFIPWLAISQRWVSDRRLVYGTAVVVGVLIAQIVFVAFDAGSRRPPPDWSATWMIANFGFAVEIGLLVGATELISRYRDEPFAPLLSVAGAFYILFNGAASALAYYLLVLLTDLAEPLRTFTAGVAAMAFFRSALFNVRIGGADVPVGPNLILLTFLKALDRTYDRERAAPRSDTVKRIVGHLSFERIKDSLPALCTDLMQNLSQDEINEMNRQVTKLSQSTSMDDHSKTLSLGLGLLNLVGDKTLQAAVNTLGSGAKAFREVDNDLLVELAIPEPETVLEALPSICASLFAATPHDPEQPPLELPELKASLSVESRVRLLAYQLVGYYGDKLVKVAATLVRMSSPIDSPPKPSPVPTPPPPPASDPPPPGDEPTG